MSKASDFEFCTMVDGDDQVAVLMGPKDDPEFDDEIGEMVRPFWPASIVMDEVTESTFLINEALSEEEVRNVFTAAGFVYSQQWQDDLNAQIAQYEK